MNAGETTHEIITKPGIGFRPNTHLFAFTDGSAAANGKKDCRAAWAYYITTKEDSVSGGESNTHGGSGSYSIIAGELLVGSADQPNTNNRAELLGIWNAIKYCLEIPENEIANIDRLTIVSDSLLCVNTITKWARKWFECAENADGKKNLDIIRPLMHDYDLLKTKIIVAVMHIYSHTPRPVVTDSKDAGAITRLFLWTGNDIADKRCTSLVYTDDVKNDIKVNDGKKIALKRKRKI